MKARIESPLLEEVAEHFAQWRRSKEKGERIPEQLWTEAVNLVDTYGASQVTRTLRLGGRDLNKRRGIAEASQCRQGPNGKTAFVEIAPGGHGSAPGAGGRRGVDGAGMSDGLRLRIRPTGGTDMLALVERFMGT